MANIIYDATNPLPANGEVSGFDLVVIDLDVTNTTGAALKVNGADHVLIGRQKTVKGKTEGLLLSGAGGNVTNEGTIEALEGIALRLSGAGTHTVINLGTVTSAGLAIEGNVESDRIINHGTLKVTSGAVGAVLLDLKGGNDFYDGALGTATGGTIKLGSGHDTAYGGSGSETFSGGEGDDYLSGGGGIDTADYAEASGGVSVDLSRTTVQGIGGGQGYDTLIDIDNVIGSTHNDTLVGSTGNNTLQGGNGDDVLEGGLGSDRLEGGGGTNTARYTGSSAAKVDLSVLVAQDTGGYGSDILIGIANLEGGSGADTFTGNDANNRLVGNGGNDTLTGGKGDDTLEGGSGEDTAVFSGGRTEYTITHNADGTVTIADVQGAQRDGSDTVKDVRLVKFADQTIALANEKPSSIFLSTSSVSENAQVGATVATIYGSDPDGDDLTYQFASNPGGYFGLDSTGEKIVLLKEIDYEVATQHAITLVARDPYGGEFTKSFTINVRNVVETTPLVRFGLASADNLTGESGNDLLSGLDGADTLSGQVGNDTLIGGAGNDILSGGAGMDIFVFDKKPSVKSNLDFIQDFTPADDTIHLSRKAFSKISKGALSSKAFVLGDHFKDKSDRVLYHKKSGGLFYDPDGSGSAKAVQIANLTKNLKISHKDFFIV